MLGCGAIGGPSRPDSCGMATTSWSATPTPRWWRRSRPTGCASKGRSSSSPHARPRSARANCPTDRLPGPGSLQAAPHRRGRRAARGQARGGGVRRLAAERLALTRAGRRGGTGPVGPGLRQLRRRCHRTGRGDARQPGHVQDRGARRDPVRADRRAGRGHRRRGGDTQVMGFVWGKEAYGATLSPLPSATWRSTRCSTTPPTTRCCSRSPGKCSSRRRCGRCRWTGSTRTTCRDRCPGSRTSTDGRPSRTRGSTAT